MNCSCSVLLALYEFKFPVLIIREWNVQVVLVNTKRDPSSCFFHDLPSGTCRVEKENGEGKGKICVKF